MRDLGQAAYEGYFDECGGKSLISGAPLPTWDKQDPKIQKAWYAAAMNVLEGRAANLREAGERDD